MVTLSSVETMIVLGVSRATLQYYVASRQLKPRVRGGAHLFDARRVLAFRAGARIGTP